MNYFLQNQADIPSQASWGDFTAFHPNFPANLDQFCLMTQGTHFQTNQSCSKVKKERVSLSGKGKWTNQEQMAYLQFIEDNLAEMETKLMRKSRKVFLNMSKLVKTRTADQCRSHHQKILIYHQSLEEIIRFYKQNPVSIDQEKEENSLTKKLAKTNVDECRDSASVCGSAVRVESHNNRFRIVIEDCLISAFHFC